MLNHKIKHLCSRIIASLAATGVFNLASSKANATDLISGNIESYQYTENPMTFTAQYTSNECKAPGDNSNISGYGPGASGYCVYTCTHGYTANGGGLNTDTSITITAGADAPICSPRYYRVVFDTNGVKSSDSQALITSFTPGSSTNTGYSSYAYIQHGTSKIGCITNGTLNTNDLSCVPDGFAINDGRYNFSGWIDKDGHTYASLKVVGNNDTLSLDSSAPAYTPISESDLTLYAHYKPAEFKVEFEPDNGTCTKDIATATFGKQLDMPTCTREGFTFSGWAPMDDARSGSIINFTYTGSL